MNQLKCDYHPNREAVDKCLDCQRLICLEDKQVVPPSGGFSFSKQTGGIYCSSCFFTRAKSLDKGIFTPQIAGAISFVVLIFFGGFVLLLFLLNVTNPFLIYFFAVFLLIAISMIWIGQRLYSSSYQSPLDLDRARILHEKLINSRVYSSSRSRNTQYCMHCGTLADNSNQFCQNCGESLHPAK